MIGEMKKLILCLLFLIVGVELHASSAHGDSLRIMSYNIHNGIGMDGKVDYARIANGYIRCESRCRCFAGTG